jgi:transposase
MTRDVKMDAQMGVSKEGYAGRIEVVAGPTGRRRRSEAEKARIAAESLTPDAIVADIARRYGATRWQILRLAPALSAWSFGRAERRCRVACVRSANRRR